MVLRPDPWTPLPVTGLSTIKYSVLDINKLSTQYDASCQLVLQSVSSLVYKTSLSDILLKKIKLEHLLGNLVPIVICNTIYLHCGTR